MPGCHCPWRWDGLMWGPSLHSSFQSEDYGKWHGDPGGVLSSPGPKHEARFWIVTLDWGREKAS